MKNFLDKFDRTAFDIVFLTGITMSFLMLVLIDAITYYAVIHHLINI